MIEYETAFVDRFCLISSMRYLGRQMKSYERKVFICHVFRCQECRELLASLLPFAGRHREQILRELRGVE